MSTITLRIDSEVDGLLAELMADGSDRSTVIGDAVRLTWRERRRHLLAESESIAYDERDRSAIAAAQRDMAELRAW